MSHFIRTQIPLRSARAVSMLAGAGVLAAALGGCALVPREPITQQPMTAVPPPPPSLQTPGSIYNPGYAGRPLFEDQRPRNVGDISEALKIPLLNLSHHLSVLKQHGFLRREKKGRFVLYSLSPDVLDTEIESATGDVLNLGCCRLELPKSVELGSGLVPRKRPS